MSTPAPGRSPRRLRGTTATRVEAPAGTGNSGPTNIRTRIVGARTGVLADFVVAVVRFLTIAGAAAARVGSRVAAVVTPLGWVMLGVIPAAFAFGYGLGWIELVVVGWAGVVLVVIAAL
ncbi:MAG: hypothetical protein ABI435_05050, partial [Pseudolysinimonas sp.]